MNSLKVAALSSTRRALFSRLLLPKWQTWASLTIWTDRGAA